MQKMNRIRISQCMIVKNEEKNIERALSWGKGIVSEQIVVDTGSTDRTVEIARQMGAQVYQFEWINDFAAAKNYAISKAKYEWIAFLDADEYFYREDAKKLLSCVENLQDTCYEGIMAAWIQLNRSEQIMGVATQIRVFRNVPEIRYTRRIHEYLTFSGSLSEKTVDMTGELSIYHTGSVTAERTEKGKRERNIKLIELELKENPYQYDMWMYLGNEYESYDEWQEAEDAYRKAISFMPEELDEMDYSATTAYLRYLNLLILRPGDNEKSIMKIYEQTIKRRPMEGDSDYLVGEYMAFKGDYQQGEIHLRRALELLERYGIANKNMLISGNIQKAYELLAICCFNNGDLAGCVHITTALLKENPYLMSTVVVMLRAFKRDDGNGSKAGDVAAFLGRSFYDFSGLKDRIFVLRAAVAAGYEEMVTIIREMFTPEELEAVDRAIGK